jgi:hypothetical protein
MRIGGRAASRKPSSPDHANAQTLGNVAILAEDLAQAGHHLVEFDTEPIVALSTPRRTEPMARRCVDHDQDIAHLARSELHETPETRSLLLGRCARFSRHGR